MSSLPQPLPPVPVQSIVYSSPVPQRPTLITTIGVVSIVVGSLGLLFNGIAGLQSFGMMMISNIAQAAATAQQAKQAALAAKPSRPADPLSMPAEDRQTVVRGLAMHRAINKARREQLDALLTKTGRQLFRLRGSDLTIEIVRQNVTESGQLPDAKGGERPDFFIVGEGRIELADDHAKFVPGNGAETVRVSAGETAEQSNWEAGLTPAQVTAIVDKVEAQSGQALPAAMKSKLEAAISAPAQGYFEPVPTVPEASGQLTNISYMVNNGVGQLTLQTNQGMLVLDQSGNTVSSMTWGGGAAGFAGPTINLNMKAAVASIVCAVLGLALAIYLLVIGILMLRQHPRAGRLHKIYAAIKIPLAIAAGIAWPMFWMSIGPAGAGAGTTTTFTPALITACVITALVGCAYPIALLIAFRTRVAREYYSTVQ
ncbi:MAG: hypothetical protein M3478_09245 [Planctomycetota bacterium]|nr:hypothetical protein [Planctomycetota bacterium]